MTPQERARQIDAEEFRRDSQASLARALEYSRLKQIELCTSMGIRPVKARRKKPSPAPRLTQATRSDTARERNQ